MYLSEVWAYFEYWEEVPPAHETLYAIILGLGAKPGKKSKRNQSSQPNHGLSQEGDANPNALRSVPGAGRVVPISKSPAFLHEHIRKLVAIEKEKGKINA